MAAELFREELIRVRAESLDPEMHGLIDGVLQNDPVALASVRSDRNELATQLLRRLRQPAPTQPSRPSLRLVYSSRTG
jgi:hypothetical protein